MGGGPHSDVYDILYEGGRFYVTVDDPTATPGGLIYASTDGLQWQAVAKWSQGFEFLAVGNQGMLAMDVTGRLLYPGLCTRRFTDVGPDHPNCANLEELAGRNLVGGFPDGTFRPTAPITRAEFAKMLTGAMGWQPTPLASLMFGDTAGHRAARDGFLQAAVAHRALGGFPDGTFRPNDPVTRAQLVKVAAAALGVKPQSARQDSLPYTDVLPSDWYAGWVQSAHLYRLIGENTGLFDGPTLDGNQPATRMEAVLILRQLLWQVE